MVAEHEESPQLREQDHGNALDCAVVEELRQERVAYGRFYYRFPNGESVCDVYDRVSLFQDYLIRDMNAGRFGHEGAVVLVTHGITLRVFLMSWFQWSSEQFLKVDNPAHAAPIILEKVPDDKLATSFHPFVAASTKALYRMTEPSRHQLPGVTPDMCYPKSTWARDKMVQPHGLKAKKPTPLGSLTW